MPNQAGLEPATPLSHILQYSMDHKTSYKQVIVQQVLYASCTCTSMLHVSSQFGARLDPPMPVLPSPHLS